MSSQRIKCDYEMTEIIDVLKWMIKITLTKQTKQ